MTKSIESLIRLALIFSLVAFCLWLYYERIDARDINTLMSVLIGGIAGEITLNKISQLITSNKEKKANGESPE